MIPSDSTSTAARPAPHPGLQVVGVSGSPRRGGNSDVILKHILQGVAAEHGRVVEVKLRDYQYQGCTGCERCRQDKICTGLKDGMTLLYPEIIQSRGLVLACPTHHYNITAWMKAFIDRLYCFYDFEDTIPRAWSSRLAGQGRKAVLAAVCEQEDRADMGFTLEAMRRPLEALGYDILAELPVFRVFARGKVKDNKDLLLQAVKMGTQLATSLGV